MALALAAMALIPLAHLGSDHWYLFLLYLAPVVIVVASIVISTVRQRRELAAEEALGEAREER